MKLTMLAGKSIDFYDTVRGDKFSRVLCSQEPAAPLPQTPTTAASTNAGNSPLLPSDIEEEAYQDPHEADVRRAWRSNWAKLTKPEMVVFPAMDEPKFTRWLCPTSRMPTRAKSEGGRRHGIRNAWQIDDWRREVRASWQRVNLPSVHVRKGAS
eukprot:TRINITY_DN65479_c0_g1_i1.p1 TRINITY_DN65479_c0_g1~~TRINITY_DN65479_c0_g1_i1.p1  ORF type:complete len:154 (-),score=25.83 TRINITY_DN65479_c0_g1_i1:170-631(-)